MTRRCEVRVGSRILIFRKRDRAYTIIIGRVIDSHLSNLRRGITIKGPLGHIVTTWRSVFKVLALPTLAKSLECKVWLHENFFKATTPGFSYLSLKAVKGYRQVIVHKSYLKRMLTSEDPKERKLLLRELWRFGTLHPSYVLKFKGFACGPLPPPAIAGNCPLDAIPDI